MMRISFIAPIVLPLLSLSACIAQTLDPEETGEAESPLVATWTAIGGTTDITPAPVSFLGKMFLFARGIGDSQVYVRSSSDGTTWSGWSALAGKTTDVGLAPVVFDGKLYVFAKGSNDNGIYVNSTSNGNTWSGWSTAFSGTTDTAVAPVVFGGKLYVFAKGIVDQTIYMTSSTNATSWSAWLAIPGTTDVAPAAVAFNGKIILYSKGIADKKIYYSTSANGTWWSPWAEFGGTTEHGVRAAVFAGDLYVTSPGLGDQRIYVSASRDLSHWSGWFELPPRNLTTGAAVGLSAFGNGLYWFAEGASDNAIYEESTPVYHLPFSSGSGWNMGHGNWDDPNGGHGFGQAYAFDFGHAEGATVVAMRAGTVIALASDRTCNTWNVMLGNPCYGAPGEGNYVLIRHADGTVAAYDHLKYNGVLVSLGAMVAEGQAIGLSGNTGNSSTPHLHVDVRQYWNSANDMGPTIPIYFKDSNHTTTPWRPLDGDTLAP
jgi:hypothetical protein